MKEPRQPASSRRRYLLAALVPLTPGLAFTARAFWVQHQRNELWQRDLGTFTYGDTGMPIDTYAQWMHVFSVPFHVTAAFLLYRYLFHAGDPTAIADRA